MNLRERVGRLPAVGLLLAVQDRYTADLGNHLAASMAFFAFLSLFPLMLLVLSLAGFLLARDPEAQRELVEAVPRAVPGLGRALGDTVETVVNSRGVTGAVGALGVVYGGLRVVDAATVATSSVFRVENLGNFAVRKVRSALALAGLGSLSVVSVSASALVALLVARLEALGTPGQLTTFVGYLGPAASFVLDFALFAVSYRVLAARRGPPWSDLWPGALLAALAWTGLKVFGAVFVTVRVETWNALYGALGGVIAAMLLLFVAARVFVYGAEFNAVRCERRDGPMGGGRPLQGGSGEG